MRRLVVVADDFGIGPETSHGILELARRGRVTATVLLVTSPFAEYAVDAWRKTGAALELGWHPCLTLDRPILAPQQVPSLVGRFGRFHPLSRFLLRLACGLIDRGEVAAELRAQYDRFVELVRQPPSCINCHHHLHAFPVVRRALASILSDQQPRPYLRRVREGWQSLLAVRGERGRRLGLALLGRRAVATDLPGNDWLARSDVGLRSLSCTPGQVVELVCHPGYPDPTLAGRDPWRLERLRDWDLLASAAFVQTIERARFVLTAPGQLARHTEAAAHAA